MVKNLTSPRSGRSVANQFLIKTNKGTFFQSYNSIVAKIDKNGNVTLSRFWSYSLTTRKYLYQFLSEFGYYGLNAQMVCKLLDEKKFKYKDEISM